MCVKISCLLDPFFLVDRLAFYVYLGWRSAQRGSKVLYLSIAQYDAVVHDLLNLDRILHRWLDDIATQHPKIVLLDWFKVQADLINSLLCHLIVKVPSCLRRNGYRWCHPLINVIGTKRRAFDLILTCLLVIEVDNQIEGVIWLIADILFLTVVDASFLVVGLAGRE